jgi:hypothetical protein
MENTYVKIYLQIHYKKKYEQRTQNIYVAFCSNCKIRDFEIKVDILWNNTTVPQICNFGDLWLFWVLHCMKKTVNIILYQ